ncbi:MAG: hypothetical protein B7Y41_11985 [Hydrogenophilales bacterium 28-61-23]|nr:MAG: hypothetical protein B7Y41_11985 [Hydrogenophilales bacterium 28-61-23]
MRIDDDSAVYYYHTDHLGTPQAMTDASGAVVWRADTEPFGKAVVKVATVENNLRLPGQYYDQETGMHYNYFRDYDPGTGRYAEADPIGLAGGLNLYGYANQNPLSFTAWHSGIRRCAMVIALTMGIADAVQAEYNYTLTLSAEIHVKPGDVINLPARLNNTGTQSFSFGEFTAGDDVSRFLAQFNQLTLDPNESFDFTYVSLAVNADAAIGTSQTEYRTLGIQFPDDSRLMTGSTGPCCDASNDPAQRTRIIVDSVRYATPLNRVTYAYPGYYSGGPQANEFARISLLTYSDYSFADSQINPRAGAIVLPIVAVPEPETWMLLAVGLLLISARKTAFARY